jgi:hypothetical protein
MFDLSDASRISNQHRPLSSYLRTLPTPLCDFSAVFFLEFFPPEFDDRLVARSH